MKKKSKNNATPRSGNNAKLRSDLGAWMLMLPSLVLFAFFVWVPLLETVRMSFYEVNGTTLVKFVGF